jgi:hypothetical protein
METRREEENGRDYRRGGRWRLEKRRRMAVIRRGGRWRPKKRRKVAVITGGRNMEI